MLKYILLASLLVSGVLSKCPADKCKADQCNRPDCVCSSTQPDIPVKDRPQIVYLSYDDAFTEFARKNFYAPIYEGEGALKNPNGCPIRATHFLRHKYTSYPDAHYYYSKLGHEMASHSITHMSNVTYWATLNQDQWRDEFYGMKEMMAAYGNIAFNDVVGVRAPHLQGGGDEQFAMMVEDDPNGDRGQHRFQYDCSMPSLAYGYVNLANGMWPYTLDYQSEQDCGIPPCPKCEYKGTWVQPMLDLEDRRFGGHPDDPNQGEPCSMLDSCVIPDPDQDPKHVFDMLMKSFERSYNGNTRAPFGVYMHAAWFQGQEWHYQGYKDFLAEILKREDVWVVPISAGIEYMKNPVPSSELHNFAPFGCNATLFPQFNCDSTQNCKYDFVHYDDLEIDQIYMNICGSDCPTYYPWLRNVHGTDPYPGTD